MNSKKGVKGFLYYLPLSFLVLIVVLVTLALDSQALDPAAIKPFLLATGLLSSLVVFWFASFTVKSVIVSNFQKIRTDVLLIILWLVALASELFFPPAAFGPVYPYTLLILIFYFFSRVVFSGYDEDDICLALACSGFFIVGGNLVYHFFLNDLWWDSFQTGELTQSFVFGRYVGTMANPNYTASVLLLFLPLFFCFFLYYANGWFRERRVSGQVLGTVLGLVSLLILLLMTLCRSSWFLAFLAFPLLLFFFYKKKMKFRPYLFVSALILFLCGGAGYLSLSASIKVNLADTFQKRVLIWEIAENSVRSNPIAGWGPGGFERVHCNARSSGSGTSSIYVHNFLLQLAGGLGIQSLVPVLLIVYPLFLFLKDAFFREENSLISFSVAFGMVLFLADNLVNVTLFVFSSSVIFFFFLAAFQSMMTNPSLNTDSYKGKGFLNDKVFHVGLSLFLFVSLSLVSMRTWNDYRMFSVMSQLRTKSTSTGYKVEDLTGQSAGNPQWFRFTYDLAGKLAVDGYLQSSLTLYSIVEGHIPFYQSVETNKRVVSQLLLKE